jgi:uncharacterized protein YhbP (UPF0306 family)
MAIRRSKRLVAGARLDEAVRRLLDASTLCAISTVSPRSTAHVSTAYFAWDERLRLIWLSDPGAAHSRNIGARPTTAVAVYGPGQRWGRPDRGVQLFGRARELAGQDARRAAEVYAARFPAFGAGDLGDYRLYRCTVRRAKLFDEDVFGAGVFVTARMASSGGLAWEQTEISTGGA